MRRFSIALLLSILAFIVVSFFITLWRSPYSVTTLIASAYEEGLVVGRNPGKAAEWYLKGAEKGDRVAQFKLGLIEYYGRGVDVDRPRGLQLISESAEHGNADAQYFMGAANVAGLDIPRDFTLAAKWYRKAAEQGHAKAQQKLAGLYFTGNGIEANGQQAFNWASKAVAQGDNEALTLLGTLYLFGKGVPADPQYAVELLTQSATAGDSYASELLGAAHLHGTGTPKDVSAALHWYTRAAEQGRVNAQFVLGHLYSSGADVPVNYPLANRWLLKAALQGHAVSLVTLAVHLDNGQGFEKNKRKACGLLRVALKQTLPDNIAGPMRVELEQEEKTLSPEQLTEVLAMETLYSSPAGLRELQGELTNEQVAKPASRQAEFAGSQHPGPTHPEL